MLPYGRQLLDERDVEAVTAVLRSAWLTTGPVVEQFESAFAGAVAARHAVAFSNGTAALHASMFALGIKPGSEVIVSSMTFAASANCVLYVGGKPVFADVDPGTLLLDPADVEARITPATRAIVAVDYAGQPCDYEALRGVANRHGLAVVADACHALGATYRGRAVGSLADLSVFSFHPVKHITTGEGGMVTTDDGELARRLRLFRNHGITSDHRQRDSAGSFFYEMVELGFNYRLTDIQSALGLSQLDRLDEFVGRRRAIAARYDRALRELPFIQPLNVSPDVEHAYHLYVVAFDLKQLARTRADVFKAMRGENIGVNVHYIPVHLHPYYRAKLSVGPGFCPIAEAAYERILSIPMFPGMSDQDVDDVVAAIAKLRP